eukprot:scaffold139876_cov35-Attheya_sp.AAC.1
MSDDEPMQVSDIEIKTGDMSWLFPDKAKNKPGVSPFLFTTPTDVWKLNFGTIEEFGMIPVYSDLQDMYNENYAMEFLQYEYCYRRILEAIEDRSHLPEEKNTKF